MTVSGPASVLALVGIVFSATACRTAYYTLELRPEGQRMERTVHTWVQSEGLDRVYSAYGLETDPEKRKELEEEPFVAVSLTGTFVGAMPYDIGNSGHLFHFRSPLGSSSLYTERFRGFDNLADILDMQQRAFNRSVDMILLLLDLAIADVDEYSEFRHFVDTMFRSDIQNLILLMNVTDTVGRTVTWGEGDFEDLFGTGFMMRSLHFMADRNYFDLGQLPTVMDALHEMDDYGLQFMAEAITRRMGRQEIPPPLQALLDLQDEDLEVIQAQFLASPELAAMVESWNSDPYLRMPYDINDEDSMEQFQAQLIGIEFDIFVASGGNVLDVTMALPSEPYETNGQWDGAGIITWEESLASLDPFEADLPNVLYAAWSEPEAGLQQRYFGIVAIDGADLYDYCLWWANLEEDRREEWTAFLESLDPAGDLVPALREFRFSDERGKPDLTGPYDYRSYAARSVLFDIEKALEAAAREASGGGE